MRTLFFLMFAFGSAAWSAQWPSWRGPTYDGISPDTQAPLRWSRTENVRWIFRLREPGNSTPIVWSNTVFLTQNLGKQRALIAVDRRNGRPRWTTAEDGLDDEVTQAANPYCAPSPVTDGERVITWFGSVGLFAYDFSGKKLWETKFGRQRHQFGYGSSPVLHGDVVYLNFGPGIQEFVVAVDKKTGKELWRTTGPHAGKDDTYGTWSTPFLTHVDGRPQLLVALRDYFAGLDPTTGTEIWHVSGLGLQAKASPISDGKTALISGDLKGAEVAVRLGHTGDVTESHRIWREFPPRRRVGTGIIRDGYVYGAQANGLLDCVNLETGDIVWAERQSGSGANSAVWSSPVLVGDRLYIHNQGGDTVILSASPQYKQIAVNSIGEPGNASPVIVDGELFLRTHAALWCFREGSPAPAQTSGAGTAGARNR